MRVASALTYCLAVATLTAATPIDAQAPQYENIRGPLLEGKAKRDAAIERCAASAAKAYAFSRFDVIGFEYPSTGGLRVHAHVNPASVRRALELSCDVDWRGNLRRLDFGRGS